MDFYTSHTVGGTAAATGKELRICFLAHKNVHPEVKIILWFKCAVVSIGKMSCFAPLHFLG
jgi:hypothetical protein